MLSNIICLFKGHNWSQVHGYNDHAAWGATCKRCSRQAETYEAWRARWE